MFLMDIMMAAVDEYARRTGGAARSPDPAVVGAYMLVDEKVAWYLLDRDVLTVKGDLERQTN